LATATIIAFCTFLAPKTGLVYDAAQVHESFGGCKEVWSRQARNRISCFYERPNPDLWFHYDFFLHSRLFKRQRHEIRAGGKGKDSGNKGKNRSQDKIGEKDREHRERTGDKTGEKDRSTVKVSWNTGKNRRQDRRQGKEKETR
jgi:hypothetical protein